PSAALPGGSGLRSGPQRSFINPPRVGPISMITPGPEFIDESTLPAYAPHWDFKSILTAVDHKAGRWAIGR
ncbi:MAG: hypothetical protein ACRD1M_18270, partial [Terriglobales bacterium]